MSRNKAKRNFSAPGENQSTADHLKSIWQNNSNRLEQEQSKNVSSFRRQAQRTSESYISVSEYGLYISKNQQNKSGFDVLGKKQNKNGANIFEKGQNNSGFNEVKKKRKRKSKMKNFQNPSNDSVSTSPKAFTKVNVNLNVLEKEKSNDFTILKKGQRPNYISISEDVLKISENKQNKSGFNILKKKQNKNANIFQKERKNSGFNEVKRKGKEDGLNISKKKQRQKGFDVLEEKQNKKFGGFKEHKEKTTKKKSELKNFQDSLNDSISTPTEAFTNINIRIINTVTVPLNIIAGKPLYNPRKRNSSGNKENTSSVFVYSTILKESRAEQRNLSAERNRSKRIIRESCWFNKRIPPKIESIKNPRFNDLEALTDKSQQSLWIPNGIYNYVNSKNRKSTEYVSTQNTLTNRQWSKLNIINEKPVIENEKPVMEKPNIINLPSAPKTNIINLLSAPKKKKNMRRYPKNLVKEKEVLDCEKYQRQKQTSAKRNNRKKKDSVNDSTKSEKGKQQDNRNLKTTTTVLEISKCKEKSSKKKKRQEFRKGCNENLQKGKIT